MSRHFRYLNSRNGKDGDAVFDVLSAADLAARALVQREDTKEFVVFESDAGLRRHVEEAPTKFLNEVVLPGQPQKFRADFDGLRQRDEDAVLDSFEDALVDCMWERYGAAFVHPLIVYTESHGPNKRSWHAIVYNVAFSCGREVQELAAAARCRMPPRWQKYMDLGIYSPRASRTLRLLGCAKSDDPERVKRLSTRGPFAAGDAWEAARIVAVTELPLMPEKCGSPKLSLQQSLPDYEITEEIAQMIAESAGLAGCANPFSVADVTQLDASGTGTTARARIRFERLRPSRCPLCARVHDNDTPYLVVAAGAVAADRRNRFYRVRLYCYRNPGESVELPESEAPAPLKHELQARDDDDADDREPGWVSHMEHRVEHNGGRRAAVDDEAFADWPGIEHDLHHEQEMRQFPPHNWRTLCVIADLMMGKTQQLLEYIERAWPREQPGEPEARLVAVSCRRSFARDFTRRFAGIGFVSYEDIDHGRIRDARVVVQVESLSRLDLRDDPPDLFIVDEAVSVIQQLCSPHVRVPYATVEIFRWLMQKSKKVILMDAFMGSQTFNVLRAARGRGGVIVQENLWSRGRELGKYMELTCSDLDWAVELRRSLRARRRLVVMTNSLKAARRYEIVVRESWAGARMRVLTGEDTDAAKRDFFRDVDEAVAGLDVLISTPVMTAGVSINVRQFDEVFAHFTGYSCGVETCMQMLGRVRRPSAGRFVVLVENNHDYDGVRLPTTPEDLCAEVCRRNIGLVEMAAPFDEVSGAFQIEMDDNGYTRVVPLKSFPAKVWLNNAALQNRSRGAFVRYFIEVAAGTGMAMRRLPPEPDAEVRLAARRGMSSAKKTVQEDEAMTLLEAPDLNADAIREMRGRRGDLESDELAALRRHFLKDAYALTGRGLRRILGMRPSPQDTMLELMSVKRQRHFRNMMLLLGRDCADLEVLRRQLATGAHNLLATRKIAGFGGENRARADLQALSSAYQDHDLEGLLALETLLRGIGLPTIASKSTVFHVQSTVTARAMCGSILSSVGKLTEVYRLWTSTNAGAVRAARELAAGNQGALIVLLQFASKILDRLFGAKIELIEMGDTNFSGARDCRGWTVKFDEMVSPRGGIIDVPRQCTMSLTQKGFIDFET